MAEVSPYNYAKFFEENYGDSLEALIQRRALAPPWIEIHPACAGRIKCSNQCPHCTGQAQLNYTAEREIPLEVLLKLVESLPGRGVRRVVLSGIFSDPLLYSDIKGLLRVIKGQGLAVGVHTTGFFLDQELKELLTSSNHPPNYITFSLDCGNHKTYNRVHRPRNLKARPFDKILRNLKDLVEMKKSRSSNLWIGVSYLLLEGNTDRDNLSAAVSLAAKMGVDCLRFTVPLLPVHYSEEGSRPFRLVTQQEVDAARERIAEAVASLGGDPLKVVVTPYNPTLQRERRFESCWHSKLIGVVGQDGAIAPCTSVASRCFRHLSRGSILEEDFWEVWQRVQERPAIPACEDLFCTRFEYEINTLVEERRAEAGCKDGSGPGLLDKGGTEK